MFVLQGEVLWLMALKQRHQKLSTNEALLSFLGMIRITVKVNEEGRSGTYVNVRAVDGTPANHGKSRILMEFISLASGLFFRG